MEFSIAFGSDSERYFLYIKISKKKGVRMTRRINTGTGQAIHVNKKWKELTQYRKDWVLKKARRLFEQKVTTSQQPLTNPERRWLIHSVYGMIKSRGIWIPYEEIYRVLSSKIKKWNDREARRLMMQHPPNEEKQNRPIIE